jgi:hypothetical protein
MYDAVVDNGDTEPHLGRVLLCRRRPDQKLTNSAWTFLQLALLQTGASLAIYLKLCHCIRQTIYKSLSAAADLFLADKVSLYYYIETQSHVLNCFMCDCLSCCIRYIFTNLFAMNVCCPPFILVQYNPQSHLS